MGSEILLLKHSSDEADRIIDALNEAAFDVMVANTDDGSTIPMMHESPEVIIVMGDVTSCCETVFDIRDVSDVPIIALQGGGDPSDRASVMQLGADVCLSRQLGMAELVARIESLRRRYCWVHLRNQSVASEGARLQPPRLNSFSDDLQPVPVHA